GGDGGGAWGARKGGRGGAAEWGGAARGRAAAATVGVSSAGTRIGCRHSRRNSRHAHRATARRAGTPPLAGPGRTGRSRSAAVIAAGPGGAAIPGPSAARADR